MKKIKNKMKCQNSEVGMDVKLYNLSVVIIKGEFRQTFFYYCYGKVVSLWEDIIFITLENTNYFHGKF